MDQIILRTPFNTSTVSVSTTILRVFGASSWTSTIADSSRQARCAVSIANTSSADAAFVKLITKNASLTSVVSSTTYDRKILPNETVVFLIGKDMDIAIVRDTGAAAANVTATEYA